MNSLCIMVVGTVPAFFAVYNPIDTRTGYTWYRINIKESTMADVNRSKERFPCARNGNLSCAIEYNGKQESGSFIMSTEALEDLVQSLEQAAPAV